jgi:hypothetical protein
MRARLLKPGFFKNEGLAELPFEGRLLYAGLWTLADREGRLEDRPARLKIELFPYDPVDVDQLLAWLHNRGFIRRYVVEGRRCIWIPTFLDHQHPHLREPASTLPDPGRSRAEHQPSTNPALGQTRPGPGRHPGPNMVEHQPGPAVIDPVIDPVTEADPVTDPDPDPVPTCTDPVSRKSGEISTPYAHPPVENPSRSGPIPERVLSITRAAFDMGVPEGSDDELIDTVQWYARQRRVDLTRAQAKAALTQVLSERPTPGRATRRSGT